MTEHLPTALTAFVVAAIGTVTFGVYITLLADELADRTRLGKALIGALLLGALTSIAEIGTSLTAAIAGHAELAANNAVGSIAAQTAFIVIADASYRSANLEHAAVSAANLMLTALLLGLLGIALFATANPDMSVMFVHPASIVLLITYVYGLRLVAHSGELPMWHARKTAATNTETSRPTRNSGSLPWLWTRFAGVGVILAGSGMLLANSGIAIAGLTGLSETFVGALLTGVTSSAPELVTAVTAVRIGALTLAVSNILGGNAFDAVILALADFAFISGPLYAYSGEMLPSLLAVTLLMSVVVLIGLLRRQRHGFANIGFEGVLLLVLYGALVAHLLA